jgi:hypothetical protein
MNRVELYARIPANVNVLCFVAVERMFTEENICFREMHYSCLISFDELSRAEGLTCLSDLFETPSESVEHINQSLRCP